MFETTYLIRLDDACPYMDRAKWQLMEDILDKYGVKPLVGIIPANADSQTIIDPEDSAFWLKVHSWEKKGWRIALHGYDHCYISEKGMQGLNPMWKRSEFAGVPLDKQREKIRRGVSILKNHGLKPDYFFAPSHTFDENTLVALQKESEISMISDTIALKPYYYKGFIFIPQIVGSARNMYLPGVYTFCYHPNTMQESDFEKLDSFLRKNRSFFVSLQDIYCKDLKEKTMFDKLLTKAFFLYRRLRHLK